MFFVTCKLAVIQLSTMSLPYISWVPTNWLQGRICRIQPRDHAVIPESLPVICRMWSRYHHRMPSSFFSYILLYQDTAKSDSPISAACICRKHTINLLYIVEIDSTMDSMSWSSRIYSGDSIKVQRYVSMDWFCCWCHLGCQTDWYDAYCMCQSNFRLAHLVQQNAASERTNSISRVNNYVDLDTYCTVC